MLSEVLKCKLLISLFYDQQNQQFEWDTHKVHSECCGDIFTPNY
jgi:hypothetical protein